jgi:repressor of nif and glnA expression
MTSVREVAKTGNGRIIAVFRTVPAPAMPIVQEKIAMLKETGIGGVFALGNTSEPLCQIPVGLNRVGIIQLGGLNPVAAAVEEGFEIENVAESGLIEFERLHSVWEL